MYFLVFTPKLNVNFGCLPYLFSDCVLFLICHSFCSNKSPHARTGMMKCSIYFNVEDLKRVSLRNHIIFTTDFFLEWVCKVGKVIGNEGYQFLSIKVQMSPHPGPGYIWIFESIYLSLCGEGRNGVKPCQSTFLEVIPSWGLTLF